MSSDPLDRIRKRFLERCRSDLRHLEELHSSGVYSHDPDALPMLIGIAHSLAGAGGTLGFPEISSRAFEFETLLIERKLDHSATAALGELIETLKRTLTTSG